MPYCRHLLNPSDHQNVSYAVELMEAIVDLNLKNKDMLTTHVYVELHCLGQIVKPLLNLFTNPSINLFDQLMQLSYASFLLLFIYRKFKSSFLTKDLYSDLQSTIQDAFVCVSIYMKHNKKAKIFFISVRH